MSATKLVPRGAVTMWSAVGGVPTSYSAKKRPDEIVGRRSDWAAGRLLQDEEKRAAILTTVADADFNVRLRETLSRLKEPGAPKASLSVKPPSRLHAVIKSDMGDWQVNETDPDGETIVLSKRPKGRWLKVSKDKRVPVEVDTTEDWYLPHKAFVERVVNYGKYRPLWGELPAQRPVLKLSLYRESTSLHSVFSRTAHRAGVHPGRFDYSSAKEGFGCVTQFISAIGVQRERLLHANRHYNLRCIIFNPISHGTEANVVTNCSGNRWRVLLRCVQGTPEDVAARLEAIQTKGFINYVPLSDFSIASNTASEIQAAASSGAYLDSCRFWFQSEAERNPLVYEHYLKYIAASNDAAPGVLQRMRSDVIQYRLGRRLSRFIDVLTAASRDGSLAEQAHALWDVVPIADRQAMASAPSSFVWNAMASQRLLSGGSRVQPGDLVVDPKTKRVREVAAGEEGAFTIFDMVLPFPTNAREALYPVTGAVTKELYDRLITEHGLQAAIDSFNASLWDANRPHYRHVVSRPTNLRWECIDDPDSLTLLKTDRFIREERRPVGLGFESDRIRAPSPLNVSDRFREEMQPRIHNSLSGTQSVAITFDLSQGSHALSMLREGFNTRHAHFHDLLTPSPSDGFRALVKTQEAPSDAGATD